MQSTQGVRSAIRATAIKAESAAGIAPNDITPLSTAIRKARDSGIDDDSEVLGEPRARGQAEPAAGSAA